MSVTKAKGFKASGISAGIKRSGKPDLSLVVSDRLASAAGVFSPNRFRSVSVDICVGRLRASGGRAKAIVASSGSANAMTGEAGRKDALLISRTAAGLLGAGEKHVLLASTGAIGTRIGLCEARVTSALEQAVRRLGSGGPDGLCAARGIMTTDKRPKEASASFRDGAVSFAVGGMAKGVGMVAPSMATILVFITTDAAVSPRDLHADLLAAVGPTLNSISVDGQMSTNDTAIVLANGSRALRPLSGPGRRRFGAALTEVCGSLARQLVADGEGATRLIEVSVRGARTHAQARAAARAVADSTLVKTAFYGEQANWGRIAQALGACEEVAFRPGAVVVKVAGYPAIHGGLVVPAGRRLLAALKRRMITVEIDLRAGHGRADVLTCDLTEGYIRENAGYLS